MRREHGTAKRLLISAGVLLAAGFVLGRAAAGAELPAHPMSLEFAQTKAVNNDTLAEIRAGAGAAGAPPPHRSFSDGLAVILWDEVPVPGPLPTPANHDHSGANQVNFSASFGSGNR